MKDQLPNWFIGAFVFCLGIYVGLSLAPKCPALDPEIKEIIEIDTLYLKDTLYIEKLVPVEVLPTELPEEIDTIGTVNNYYTPFVFQDFQSTDLFNISITDTISQNSIFGRSIAYELKSPQITKTRTVFQKPRYSFSAHIDTRLNPSLQFGFKQGYIGAGYDFRYKEPYVSIGIKLWEK